MGRGERVDGSRSGARVRPRSAVIALLFAAGVLVLFVHLSRDAERAERPVARGNVPAPALADGAPAVVTDGAGVEHPLEATREPAGRAPVGRTIVVRAVGDTTATPLSGSLAGYRLRPGRHDAVRLDVTRGSTVIADHATSADERGTHYFTAFTTADGAALAIVSGAFFPGNAESHVVEVRVEEAWLVHAVDAFDGRRLGGLEVRFVDRAFHTPVPPEPTGDAQALDAGHDSAVLPPAAKRVYWLRVPRYEWRAVEWERRAHVGHAVSLRPLGAILARCACGEHELAVDAIDAPSQRRTTWRMPSGERGPDLPFADRYVRVGWTSGGVEYHETHHVVATHGTTEIAVECRREPGRLLVHAIGYDEAPSVGLHSMDVWRADSPGPTQVGARPRVELGDTADAWTFVWESLPPGPYLVQIDGGVLHPAILAGGDTEVRADRGGHVPREVVFVDATSGAELAPRFVRWSMLAGALPGFERTVLPESRGVERRGDEFLLSMPPGELSFVVIEESGPEFARWRVAGDARRIEIALARRFRVELVNVPPHVPPWWLDEFRLTAGGVDLALTRSIGGVGVWGSISTATPPDTIHVPSPDASGDGVRVVLVPEGVRAVNLDFSGGVSFR